MLGLLWWGGAGAWAGAEPDRLARLSDRTPRLEIWDQATGLADPSGALGLAEVRAREDEFRPLTGPRANLGRRAGGVWLRIPVQVADDSKGTWVLQIDYPSLDRIELYVFDGPRLEQQALLGDHIAFAARPMASRSHAATFQWPAGARRTLWLRLETTGTMMVPITLQTPVSYQAAEDREQILQGLLAGMGLCLLVYSLSQWLSLRDGMFGFYALALLGNVAFFSALSGIGPQHVWGGSLWLTRDGPPLCILVGILGSFFFVLRALEVRRDSVWTARATYLCGMLTGATLAAFVAGVIGYGTAQTVAMALGPTPLILVLPTAVRRLRAGDRAASYLLAGWGFYSLGTLVLVGTLVGVLPTHFWTLHAFQFASVAEMMTWMLVLGERVQQVRMSALRVEGERDAMRSLAITDTLTGLLNRRGLQEALPPLLERGTLQEIVAVYLIDLDGFKAVNDRHGHAVGDLLLQEVARVLRREAREAALWSRLGGDEFVVVATGLRADADAERLGLRMLAAFDSPIDAAGVSCSIGLTIGYALAPQDGDTATALLKQADAAMYAGKQDGRRCLRRGRATVGSA
jgi:diguanylate cyclase (GGDEF)-like protein